MSRAVNKHGLTEKQERFAQAFIECGENATLAYRQSYTVSAMKPETVSRKAHDVANNGKVLARINELREQLAKRHNVTVDSLVAELDEARKTALGAETPQTSAAVAATMGKAKLMGLDKQVLEHTGAISVNVTPADIAAFKQAFNGEC